jgi:hypothetical protein
MTHQLNQHSNLYLHHLLAGKVIELIRSMDLIKKVLKVSLLRGLHLVILIVAKIKKRKRKKNQKKKLKFRIQVKRRKNLRK